MSAHTYIRFVTPLISCFFIFLFKIYEIEKGWIKTVIYYSLILFSCIGIFLNLYLLKSMMELGDYFSNIFTSGVLRVILENICGSF